MYRHPGVAGKEAVREDHRKKDFPQLRKAWESLGIWNAFLFDEVPTERYTEHQPNLNEQNQTTSNYEKENNLREQKLCQFIHTFLLYKDV